MSLLDKDLETLNTASNFQFSATDMQTLIKAGVSEYTLVVIACDTSSSVHAFSDELEKMLKQILDACQKSPRKEHLMLRLVQFNSIVDELHGFKLLNTISTDDYNGILSVGGMTALAAAGVDAVESVTVYGKQLMDQDIIANAIVFIITDGQDNDSRGLRATNIKTASESAMQNEALESLTVVLVGVTGDDNSLDRYLQGFKDDAGITQYVGIGNASPAKLAKLAQFVSQSISSTSQALKSGGPSQPISFSV